MANLTLTELLDDFVSRLPAEQQPAGLRPGATARDLDEASAFAGWHLRSDAREWFSWHDGQALVRWDDESGGHITGGPLPFGSSFQLATAAAFWGRQGTSTGYDYLDEPYTPVGNAVPIIVGIDEENWFLVEANEARNSESIWFTTAGMEAERVFASLSEAVRHASLLLERGLLTAAHGGGTDFVDTEELLRRGFPIADDWERFRWEAYGALPASAR